jgi:hypothetical protein
MKQMINTEKSLNILFFFLIPVLFGCNTNKSELLYTKPGFDWSLPSNVKPTPNTGFTWIWGNWKWVNDWQEIYPLEDTNNVYFAEYIIFDWADVNPQPGIYDFSYIDKRIDSILNDEIPGLGFALWPRIYARSVREETKLHGTGTLHEGDPMLPRWLEDFSKVAEKPLWLKGKKEVEYLTDGAVAAWIPNSVFLDALEMFLDTLGARYKDHPKMAWVECRFNDSHWGEGGFRSGKKEIQRAEKELQLDLENYKTYMFRFIDMWADAFRKQEHKIVFNDWEPTVPGLPEKYRPIQQEILARAIDKGMGGRDGQVEVWNRYLTAGYGNVVNDDGYIIFNDDYPPVKEGRVWFTENEAYIFPGPRRTFGPAEFEEYRWFTSNLRLLQMRRNWVWIKKEACFKWPEITRYMQLSLGKTPETSLDGFCNLREGYVHIKENGENIGDRPVKNFERWVWQRDIGPDGQTKPVIKFDIHNLHQWASARGYEYKARSTNLSEDQTSLYFNVSKEWFNEQHDIQLFVTYLDSMETTWQVVYPKKEGLWSTPKVSVGNSGEWKTAVFSIPDFYPGETLPGNMDFKIRVTGENDGIFRLVRVTKWNNLN